MIPEKKSHKTHLFLKVRDGGGCELVTPTGTAAEAGLLAGDLVVKVGDVDTRHFDGAAMTEA